MKLFFTSVETSIENFIEQIKPVVWDKYEFGNWDYSKLVAFFALPVYQDSIASK